MKVNCIGSGNVAWHLTHALDRAGHSIEQILGRDSLKAKELARKFGAHYGTDLKALFTGSDLTILAVPDDQIAPVLRAIPELKGILVHTCGSVPVDVLKEKAHYCGVIYPLQSLTRHVEVDMYKVPVLVESADEVTEHTLLQLAEAISNSVCVADFQTRARYQLAAVIANNFSNYLFIQSAGFLESYGLNFNLLQPLLEQSALKLRDTRPFEAQTGPARRGDVETLRKHRKMLEDRPELLELYDHITAGILRLFHPAKGTADKQIP